jgi:hypothetical protein
MRHPHRLVTFLTLLLVVPAVPVAASSVSAPPAHDDRTAATLIDGLPFTDRVDVTGATRAIDDPELTGPDCWPIPDRTVWYSFTPDDDVRAAADTHGSDHDTLLAVFAASGEGLTEVACNDDAGGRTTSRVHLDLEAATTYLIQVAAHEGQEGGELQLRLEIDDRPLLGGETAISPTAALRRPGGQAIVGGTLTCTRSASVAVDYVVVQGRSRSYGWTELLPCEPGHVVTWSASHVVGDRLRRGDATVIANTYYQDGLDYRVVPTETSVTLRRSAGR